MEKSVFISYRRDGGDAFAQLLYDRLTGKGYDVFYDIESLASGAFLQKIYDNIEQSEDVLIVLSPNALARCENEDDVFRAEIRWALTLRKNVIPIFIRKFTFPETLPEDIEELQKQNGIEIADMSVLESKLKKLETYLHAKPCLKESQENISFEQAESRQEIKNLDREIEGLFDRLFGCTKGSTEEEKNTKNSLQMRLKEAKQRFYIKQMLYAQEGKEVGKDAKGADGEEKLGKRFRIRNPEGYDIRAYAIRLEADSETLTKYYSLVPLPFCETEDQKGYCFFVMQEMFFEKPAGVELLLLGFGKRDVCVQSAFLEWKNSICKVTDTPVFLQLEGTLSPKPADFEKKSWLYEVENTEVLCGTGENKNYWEADVDRINTFIFDPETKEIVKRKLYFDETHNSWKAQAPLKTGQSYIVIRCKSPDGRYIEPLSPLEIGTFYRIGAFGFPKDMLKAAEYLEKDGSKEAFYQISQIFREEEYKNPEEELFWLKCSADAGYEKAIDILKEKKQNYRVHKFFTKN